MQKAILFYNPSSGRRRDRRLADVEAARAVLEAAGVEAVSAPTSGPGQADGQVQQAIREGYDTIFACGGDGTVHEVLQGLVGTQADLGIIPLGTANSLAYDLGIPESPALAARAALTGTRRRISVARVDYQDFSGNPASRYVAFIVGIGADAHLFYKLNATAKQTFGMAAYCAKATYLWFVHPKPYFEIEYCDGAQQKNAEISQLLAVRIRDFGGVLRKLAPGASLDRDDLRLVLFRTRSRIRYLRYIIRGLLRADWQVPGIELAYSTDAKCCVMSGASSSKASRILIEADGELLGMLPARVSMVHDAVNLLVPKT